MDSLRKKLSNTLEILTGIQTILVTFSVGNPIPDHMRVSCSESLQNIVDGLIDSTPRTVALRWNFINPEAQSSRAEDSKNSPDVLIDPVQQLIADIKNMIDERLVRNKNSGNGLECSL